jgi:hypothetical protein
MYYISHLLLNIKTQVNRIKCSWEQVMESKERERHYRTIYERTFLSWATEKNANLLSSVEQCNESKGGIKLERNGPS